MVSYDVTVSTSQPSFTIDTVDLGSSSASDELGAALERTGFVQLVGHGIDEAVRAEHRSACDSFFALPESSKLAYTYDDPTANRGYRRKGSEALSYSLGRPAPPDLFESFNASVREDAEGSQRFAERTPWPDADVPGFRGATEGYIAAVGALVHDLDVRIGELLDIDWLAARSSGTIDTLATINYRPNPDGTEPAVEGQQRMGAHSDYTSFTVLDADPVPGLQIVTPAGEWADVQPEPGALLMNVGDVLAMLTNDRWPSTLHRVVPMSAGSAPFRRSIAYFHYPDLDLEIAPLAAFVEDEPHYEAVTVEAHVFDKLAAPKVHEKASGVNTDAGRLS